MNSLDADAAGGRESSSRPAPGRIAPRDARDLAEALREHPGPLEPVGAGSKRSVGRPVAADLLDLAALAGVVDYAPEELVLTARAATPLAAVEELLAARGQRLAFEPPSHAALLGAPAGQTIGGVLAANLSGPRRPAAGAARDHFLGFAAVTARGEPFKAGGRVVKNVTGYDLPKLLAGSWGTLAVLTEVTVRVAPAPEVERTLLVPARTPAQAVALSTTALASPCEVSGAAFEPGRGLALRIEGFEPSVAARAARLLELLGRPEAEVLEGEASGRLWRAVGGADALAGWPVVWRLSVPPSDAPAVLAALEPEHYFLDWGGGRIWAAYDAVDAARVRGAVARGHALLFKAPASARAAVDVFDSGPPAAAALAARVKQAFDPDGKLNPGRMG
ncbi:MAG TPA: FAD-binding protein [Gammaproteobacteria bacterium]